MQIKIDEKDFAKLLEDWLSKVDLNSERFIWNDPIARVLKAGLMKQGRWKNAARGYTKPKPKEEKKIEPETPKIESKPLSSGRVTLLNEDGTIDF